MAGRRCRQEGGNAVLLLLADCHAARLLTALCATAGGYLPSDKYVQGSYDPGNSYSIWRWDDIDTFVYFSHHLVTIPPPGWISAAHVNGVRVLGTFITEWEAGRRKCEQLFGTPEAAQKVSRQQYDLHAGQVASDGWGPVIGTARSSVYLHTRPSTIAFHLAMLFLQTAEQLAAVAAYHGFEGW
jgi:hypothetical protein